MQLQRVSSENRTRSTTPQEKEQEETTQLDTNETACLSVSKPTISSASCSRHDLHNHDLHKHNSISMRTLNFLFASGVFVALHAAKEPHVVFIMVDE